MIGTTSFLAGVLIGTTLTMVVLFVGYRWRNFIGDDEDNWTGNSEEKK